MRVLHVTPYFAPAWVYGGPPRSVLGLCQGLQSAGVEIDVLTTTANGAEELPPSRADADRYGGIRVRYVRRSRPRFYFAAPLGAPLQAMLDRVDICHVHGLWNAPEWIATRALRARGIPYVLSPRGMLLGGALAHHGWRKRACYPVLEKASVTGAARLHATSADEARQLSRFADPSRIIVVPNGVDVAAARAARAGVRYRARIAPDDPIVLFLGRLHPMKRLDLLIEAISILRRTDDRIRLVIAGPDEGRELARLRPALTALGDGVRVIGEVGEDDKWAWIHEASTLVCCSDSENFGLSVAEAMAAGRAVVVTRTCPWPDVERAGAGLWVEQRVDTVVDAIRRILADPRQARAMGERGKLLIDRAYSWSAVGRLMARAYEDLLRERRASAVA